jgi:hypothetical protein
LFSNKRIEISIGFGKFYINSIEAGKHVSNGLHGFANDLDDGLVVIQDRLLFEQTDRVAFTHGDLADVVLVHPRHDTQQGGLAGTVQTENADLGAVIETERDITQYLLVRGMDAPNAHHGVNDLGIGRHAGMIVP